MDGKHGFGRRFAFCLTVLSCLALLASAGCRLGRRDPYIQNALETFRVERDAAEDRYYQMKQQHDEAEWKIESLEKKIDELTNDSSKTSSEDIESLKEDTVGSQFSSPKFSEEYLPDQVSTTVGFERSRSDKIVGVELDPNLTRGFDSQGKSGDDGVVVVVRPVNEAGEFIPKSAPITISLLDPAQKGIRQRVGLWKFSADQVASRMDQKYQAIVFRLPWQRYVPKNSDLMLFIRYQTPDGKREVSQKLKVVLDGQPNSRWTEVQKSTSVAQAHPSTVRAPKFQAANGRASGSARVNRGSATPNYGTSNYGGPNQEKSILVQPVDDSPSEMRIARPDWSPLR